jgi:(2Fe-2S) ferredoxin/ubiquinone/menaquinone biosynthesis C-methylase UbiE
MVSNLLEEPVEPFRYHVFVCTQEKAEGVPCCPAAGSGRVLDALHHELGAKGLSDEVQVSSCGCQGICDSGPVMIVYPEGTWYTKLTSRDVPEIVESHFQGGRRVARLERTDSAAMKSEMIEHRNQYLAMLKGKDAAGILPDDISETIRGFMASRVVLTALELDVFTAVGKGETAQRVASKIEASVRGTEMLLNALVSLKLLAKHDKTYTNSGLAARFLVEGTADSARQAQLHAANMWRRWSTLTDAVRNGTAVEQGGRNGWVKPFIAAMDHNARGRASTVARAAELNGAKRLLDLGGGSGAYSIAFAKACPALSCEVVDLPEVLPIAEEHIRQAGMQGRISTRAGDMLSVPLEPGKYDVVLLSAICHMFSAEENRQLLARAYGALARKGKLVISDFILEPDRTAPRQAALFALSMLVGTRAGASYSEAEYSEWMKQAGFAESKRVRIPGPANLMIATK